MIYPKAGFGSWKLPSAGFVVRALLAGLPPAAETIPGNQVLSAYR